MSDICVKSVRDISYYQGPHAIPGMKFRTAGRELGVSAWGMNVIEIDAGCTSYPEHDHVADGQEEVYVLLKGSAMLKADGQEWPLEPGSMARVGPGLKRKIIPGPTGASVLAIGAAPGKAFVPRP